MEGSVTGRWGEALAAGAAGAVALTSVHQLAQRVAADAPRMDVLGERAIARAIEASGGVLPPQPTLHRWALAGDLVANSMYYSMVACGRPVGVWSRAVALGLAAGAGALLLPRPLGLGTPPKSDRLANQVMTVAWYLGGALVAAAASRGLERLPKARQHRGGRMADKERDISREPNAVVPETNPGTTAERDFGKTDRYANQDQEKEPFNFRTTGDGTAWDAGRETSIAGGTGVETETRAADAGTPGVQTRPSDDALED